MRKMMVVAMAGLFATSANAQEAPMAMPMPAACPATPAPLPSGFAGWSAKAPVTAGASVAVPVVLGESASATLLPTPQIAYPVTPGRPGNAASSGGVFSFTVTEAGRYRVSLSAGAWVDVASSGKALASVAHSHGPACSGIAKLLDFDLAPGSYVLEVAGSNAPVITLMVAKLAV